MGSGPEGRICGHVSVCCGFVSVRSLRLVVLRAEEVESGRRECVGGRVTGGAGQRLWVVGFWQGL